jgi:hypothetical protein
MSRIKTQRAILSAELYWFGGHLGAPKVYDSGTSFNATPTLRNSGDVANEDADEGADDHGKRKVSIQPTDDGGWEIHFDGV